MLIKKSYFNLVIKKNYFNLVIKKNYFNLVIVLYKLCISFLFNRYIKLLFISFSIYFFMIYEF